jgi:hypothetical protein
MYVTCSGCIGCICALHTGSPLLLFTTSQPGVAPLLAALRHQCWPLFTTEYVLHVAVPVQL